MYQLNIVFCYIVFILGIVNSDKMTNDSHLNTFRDWSFLSKKSENAFVPKNGRINKLIVYEKVLLKSFPMNGHVTRFRQFLIYWQFLCPSLSDRSYRQSLKS
jgi:hypothetical protein